MTRAEWKIHDSILTKLRRRIDSELDEPSKAYLLGLEAGELLKGNDVLHRRLLQINFEESKSLGVKIQTVKENV